MVLPALWLLLSAPPPFAAAASKTLLRYHFEPGLRLTYSQSFERHTRNAEAQMPSRESTSVMEWTTHVLVTDQDEAWSTLGFQRNRTRAELLSFRDRSRDRLAQQTGPFQEQVERIPQYFAEANRISARGEAALPWSAARERDSDLLYGLHEVIELPSQPVAPGDVWAGAFPLGLEFRATEWTTWKDQQCLSVDGTRQTPTLNLRYTFCPQLGAVVTAHFEGSYPALLMQVHERWQISLVDVRRESVQRWLDRPEHRLGVLAAQQVATRQIAKPERFHALLETGNEEIQRRLLSTAYRSRLDPPPTDRLRELLRSDSPRVRTLALRLLAQDEDFRNSAVHAGKADPDYFVRRAAAQLESVSPLETETLGPASSTDTLPAWFCGEAPGWPERVKAQVDYPEQVTGFTIRRMQSPQSDGWPYLVYVPSDYRRDQPVPLIIYLSGAQGRAMLGISTSRQAIAELGYLVVFPEANGYWWHDRSTQIVATLVDEVTRSFNIDPNQVYIAGFSNGGTGTLHYATLWPHRFAAMSNLMGAGAFPLEADPPQVINAATLPSIFIHGQDDPQIAVRTARETVRHLRRFAVDETHSIELHVLKRRGHDVWIGNDEGLTAPFFQRHERNPFPRRVRFRLRDLKHPRHYWIEVTAKGRGLAEVTAEFVSPGELVIKTRRVRSLRLLLRKELLATSGLRVELNGRQVFAGDPTPNCELLYRSLAELGDPYLAYSTELVLDVP